MTVATPTSLLRPASEWLFAASGGSPLPPPAACMAPEMPLAALVPRPQDTRKEAQNPLDSSTQLWVSQASRALQTFLQQFPPSSVLPVCFLLTFVPNWSKPSSTATSSPAPRQPPMQAGLPRQPASLLRAFLSVPSSVSCHQPPSLLNPNPSQPGVTSERGLIN